MRRDPQYRYLTNDSPDHLEIHDLDNEHTGASECQIDEIKNSRYLIGTRETHLIAWLNKHPSYDGCKYCLAQYHNK